MNKTSRIGALDAVRGFAAFSVVIHHMLLTLPAFALIASERIGTGWVRAVAFSPLHLLWGGHEAVILFFVLSGFVLSIPYHVGAPDSYPQYVVRRIARIYLPYLAAIFLSVILMSLISHPEVPGRSDWFNEMWRQPLSWSSARDLLLMLGGTNHNFDTATWSLVHEMRISFIFPALALGVQRLTWWQSLLTALVLSVGARVATVLFLANSPVLASFGDTLYFMAFFIVGAVFALHREAVGRWLSAKKTAWKAALLGCGLLLYNWQWEVPSRRLLTNTLVVDWAIVAGTVVILLLAINFGPMNAFLERPGFLWLGKASYSLYLIHPVVQLVFVYVAAPILPLPVVLVLSVGTSVAVAGLMYRWVEAPSNRLGKLASGKLPGPSNRRPDQEGLNPVWSGAWRRTVAVLTIAGLISGVFLGGLVIGVKKYPPYAQLEAVFRHIRPQPQPDQPQGSASEVDAMPITLRTAADVDARRAEIVGQIWGAQGWPRTVPSDIATKITDPRYSDIQSLGQIDRVTVSMDRGITSVIYVFHPKTENHQLMIYHEGHAGDFIAGKATIAFFLNRGYTVAALSLPLMGMNSQPTVTLKELGTVKLVTHDLFYLLDREDGRSSLRFYLEPVAQIVNYALSKGYQSVNMIGISGGGLVTTLAAALDPRIQASFPVAGSLPLALRTADEVGDYEYVYPPLYSVANELELYVMGASGQGRMQLQILNQFDTCCFAGTRGELYQQRVHDAVASLGAGAFNLYTDSSHEGHAISPVALDLVAKELEKGRK